MVDKEVSCVPNVCCVLRCLDKGQVSRCQEHREEEEEEEEEAIVAITQCHYDGCNVAHYTTAVFRNSDEGEDDCEIREEAKESHNESNNHDDLQSTLQL